MDRDWATLEAVIAKVLADCDNGDDRQMILDRMAVVRDSLAKLMDNVEARAAAHQMLVAHLEACTATEEIISRLSKELLSDKLTAGQISELHTDLNNVRSLLTQLESHIPEVKALMTRAKLVLKNRTTRATLDFDATVQKMLDCIDNSHSQLCVKAERLSEISETWHVYNDTRTSVQSDLRELQEIVSAAVVEELSLVGVREFMERLLDAQKHWSEIAASYKRLNSVKQQLAVLDPSSVDETEDEFGQSEAARNALKSVLSDSIDRATLVVESWESFHQVKNRVESVLLEVKSVLSEPTQPGNLQALRERLIQIKVFVTFVAFVSLIWVWSIFLSRVTVDSVWNDALAYFVLPPD